VGKAEDIARRRVAEQERTRQAAERQREAQARAYVREVDEWAAKAIRAIESAGWVDGVLVSRSEEERYGLRGRKKRWVERELAGWEIHSYEDGSGDWDWTVSVCLLSDGSIWPAEPKYFDRALPGLKSLHAKYTKD
jgi:hypothetical protein